MIYAHDGEPVTCTSGHLYGWFVRDVHLNEPVLAASFEYADGTQPRNGELIPRCHCGELALRVDLGMQAFIGGEWRTFRKPNPLDGTRLWDNS